ncbi:disease resistance protein RPS2 protein [Dioscorea alata]|uniref:Disease resistance protein RPS2 protein n=1 Tax=Dioscorea alata TaxID=55571 RepID=A0ACB7TU97_DIOAL|nr:disease resistance protein RPS2 protein [Dioscorea alata]
MIDSIINFVWSPIKEYVYKESKYVLAWESNMSALQKEMLELNSKLEDLQSKVDAADRQGKNLTSESKSLLDRAKKLQEQSKKMEERCKTMSKCLADIPLDVFSGYQLSKKAEHLLPEVKESVTKISTVVNNVARAESMPQRFQERLVNQALGVDSVLEQLQHHFQDVNVRVIGVYGMAAVGKTVLLGELNNQLREMDLDCIIWVDMPKDSCVDKVQDVVGQWLGITWQDTTPQKERARLITRQLNKSKFVLILDEVWKPLDLAKVGIPIPRRPSQSKIILATRIEGMCSELNADVTVRVECMDWKEAWTLFEETAGKQLINSNKEIRRHAKQLFLKCGGLPLALTKLGRAMATRKSVHEWQLALTTIDIAPWELLGKEIFSDILRPSYDNLANDKLRTCLLYCSLYPEGFSIYKEWIIDYCIGEGIIGDIYIDVQEIYNKGHELLGILQAASLLEEGEDENHVKMHPVVRGLALWIACDCGEKPNKWLVRPQADLHEAPMAEKWKAAERVSLMRNNITEISEIPESPNVQTLMLQHNRRLSKICDGFFTFMTKLRVLDLSHTGITELPAGVGVMTELRYLDLCGTDIKQLPSEIGKLKQLRFLLLSYMKQLAMFPTEVISNLTKLQVFYMYNSYGDWKVGSIGNGVDFDELNALKQLTAMEITIQSVHALQRLAQSHRLVTRTSKLHIRACQGLTTIDMPYCTILGRVMRRLRELRVSDSDELKEVIIVDCDSEYGETNALPKLEILGLYRLSKAKIFWYGGCLRSLTELSINGCSEMEYLIYLGDDDDDGDEVSEEDEEDGEQVSGAVIDAFPNLKVLLLKKMPKLKSLSEGRRTLAFPSLEYLGVFNCPNLKKLKLKAEKLKMVLGTMQWWNGLEWEDDSMKSLLQPLFRKKAFL